MVFDKVFKKALKSYYLENGYSHKKWLQLAEKAHAAARRSFRKGHYTYCTYYETLRYLALRKIGLELEVEGFCDCLNTRQFKGVM